MDFSFIHFLYNNSCVTRDRIYSQNTDAIHGYQRHDSGLDHRFADPRLADRQLEREFNR
eukprot:UN0189